MRSHVTEYDRMLSKDSKSWSSLTLSVSRLREHFDYDKTELLSLLMMISVIMRLTHESIRTKSAINTKTATVDILRNDYPNTNYHLSS